MLITEEDENNFIKNKDDKLSRYLRNVLQRYFEIEKEYSYETKEAIIIQAFTRLKEWLNAKRGTPEEEGGEGYFLICINEKSGAVCLDITDFNGEPKFEKKTAFNKDFCENNEEQEDTIVRGNDIRLNDQRIPLDHVHEIKEIQELSDILSQYNLSQNFHSHGNSNTIDMLRYTGAMATIDLFLLERLTMNANTLLDYLEEQDNYTINIIKRYINQFEGVAEPVKTRLQYIKGMADSWITVTKEDLINESTLEDFEKEIKEIIKDFFTVEDFNELKRVIEKSPRIISEGYLDTDKDFNININTMNIRDYVQNPFDVSTKIQTDVTYTKDFTVQDLDDVTDHNLINSDQEVLIEYDITENNNTKTIVNPLPAMINIGENDYILLTYEVSNRNKLFVYGYRLANIPFFINKGLSFSFELINKLYKKDNEWEYRSHKETIYIDSTDTNYITKGNYEPVNIFYNREFPFSLENKNYTIRFEPGQVDYDEFVNLNNQPVINFTQNNKVNNYYIVRVFRNLRYEDTGYQSEWIIATDNEDNPKIFTVSSGENLPNFTVANDFDTLNPDNIEIKGKCISVTSNQEQYEVNVKYSDRNEYIVYKIQFIQMNSLSACNSFMSRGDRYDLEIPEIITKEVTIDMSNSCSSNEIQESIGSDYNILDPNNPNLHVTKTIISNNEIKYNITITRNWTDGIPFENLGKNNSFADYLRKEDIVKLGKKYHFNMINDINQFKNISFICTGNEYNSNESDFYLEETKNFYNKSDNKFYSFNEKDTLENDITLTSEANEINPNYIGIFPIMTLQDILENAKIYYKIYAVPNKGES